MRQIIFKAKRVDSGEWVEGDLMHFDSNTYVGNVWDNREVEPSTVCQFTGLLDKNGKKIFEGDIVDDGANHWYFAWKSGEYRLTWGKFVHALTVGEYSKHTELTGKNIHD